MRLHALTGLYAAGLLLISRPAPAVPDLQNLYINPERQTRSEAIIFYNSDNSCPSCPTTIDMIIAVLQKYYSHRLHAYLINAGQHPEFISAFNLKGPLTLVLVRISDGASFGYASLAGLQSLSNSPRELQQKITEKIDNFLSLPPEN